MWSWRRDKAPFFSFFLGWGGWRFRVPEPSVYRGVPTMRRDCFFGRCSAYMFPIALCHSLSKCSEEKSDDITPLSVKMPINFDDVASCVQGSSHAAPCHSSLSKWRVPHNQTAATSSSRNVILRKIFIVVINWCRFKSGRTGFRTDAVLHFGT